MEVTSDGLLRVSDPDDRDLEFDETNRNSIHTRTKQGHAKKTGPG